REAQKQLAQEVTALVHGQTALDAAMKASSILFGAQIGDIDAHTFADVVAEVATTDIAAEALDGSGTALAELLVLAGLCPSKGQARRDIDGGGIYINNERVVAADRMVSRADLLFERYVLVRKGKKSY